MSDDILQEARALLKESALDERTRAVELLSSLTGSQRATEALAELLEEASWYLRERVVEALRDRPEAFASVLRIVKEGSWFARASACEVLAGHGNAAAIPAVLEQVQNRNVSLQKSAVAALLRIAGSKGERTVAQEVARMPPAARRRVLARIGHQAPHWVPALESALGELPSGDFAPEPPAPVPRPEGAAETPAIVRFRKWLAGLPSPSRETP